MVAARLLLKAQCGPPPAFLVTEILVVSSLVSCSGKRGGKGSLRILEPNRVQKCEESAVPMLTFPSVMAPRLMDNYALQLSALEKQALLRVITRPACALCPDLIPVTAEPLWAVGTKHRRLAACTPHAHSSQSWDVQDQGTGSQ